MKKLLNIMLATFLVFTVVSFAVSAEEGATNNEPGVATDNKPSNPGEATSNNPTYEYTVVDGETNFGMKFDVPTNTEGLSEETKNTVEGINNGTISIKPTIATEGVKDPSNSKDALVFDVKPINALTGETVETKGIAVSFKLNVSNKFTSGKVDVIHYGDDGSYKTTYKGIDVDADGNINVETSLGFSTFTVVKHVEEAPAKPATPTGSVTCEESMGSANWVWSEAKKACVYKVSNTSVK